METQTRTELGVLPFTPHEPDARVEGGRVGVARHPQTQVPGLTQGRYGVLDESLCYATTMPPRGASPEFDKEADR